MRLLEYDQFIRQDQFTDAVIFFNVEGGHCLTARDQLRIPGIAALPPATVVCIR